MGQAVSHAGRNPRKGSYTATTVVSAYAETFSYATITDKACRLDLSSHLQSEFLDCGPIGQWPHKHVPALTLDISDVSFLYTVIYRNDTSIWERV